MAKKPLNEFLLGGPGHDGYTTQPCTGERTRLLGIVNDRTLTIWRRGPDFLRVCGGGYGLNKHLVDNAETLGFDKIVCQTPTRSFDLPPLAELKQRTTFAFHDAGFEAQILIRLPRRRWVA